MSDQTQPTLPFPPGFGTDAPARRRRRVWPWIAALVVVLGLLVAAWFLVEAIAKDFVAKAVRQQIHAQFDIPADQTVDVEIDGPLLIQLIGGSFGQVRISAEDVTVEGLTGDVDVTLHDLSIRDGFAMSGGDATVTLDAEQLRELMSTVDGFPTDSLGLAAPNVTMTFPLSVFGAQFPVGVAMTPRAADGDLVLTPAALQLGDGQVDADALRDRFGSFADPVLRDWTVCIAGDLPAGITLTGAEVAGDELVAHLAIDGRLLTDPALQEPGTCP